MSRLGRIVVAALLVLAGVLPARAGEANADWRRLVPKDWHAAVVAPDIERVDNALSLLLEPWAVPRVSIRGFLSGVGAAPHLADRAWVLVLVADADSRPTPRLLVPTDDHDALCDALGADRVQDLAIASLGGYEFGLRRGEGWSIVGPLDSFETSIARPATETAMTSANEDPAGADVRVLVSPVGAALSAELLKRAAQADQAAGRRRPQGWPMTLTEARQVLTRYTPVAEVIAGWEETVVLDLAIREGDLVATVTLPIGDASIESGDLSPTGDKQPVTIASLRATGPLPAPFTDLLLAVLQSRPGDIDSSAYPVHEWRAYADALRALLGGVTAAELSLIDPPDDAPLAANQAARFRWAGEPDGLGAALQKTAVRWNQLIDAAETRTPLRLAVEPIASEPSGSSSGWRMTIDLVAGLGMPPTEDLVALLARFYGPGGNLVVDVTPTGDGEWLANTLPEGQRRTSGPPLAAGDGTGEDRLIAGEFRLDRWVNWTARIEQVGIEDAVGFKPKKPMGEAPAARLAVRSSEGKLSVEATLPREAYQQLVKRRRGADAGD